MVVIGKLDPLLPGETLTLITKSVKQIFDNFPPLLSQLSQRPQRGLFPIVNCAKMGACFAHRSKVAIGIVERSRNRSNLGKGHLQRKARPVPSELRHRERKRGLREARRRGGARDRRTGNWIGDCRLRGSAHSGLGLDSLPRGPGDASAGGFRGNGPFRDRLAHGYSGWGLLLSRSRLLPPVLLDLTARIPVVGLLDSWPDADVPPETHIRATRFLGDAISAMDRLPALPGIP